MQTFLKFLYHRIEVGPQVFRQKVVSVSSPVTCVDGFQNLQTITLGCRDEFCLMSSLELVSSVSFALTEHHGIQILPQGQCGMRTEQETLTCFGNKTTDCHTKRKHASQQEMVSRDRSGQNRKYC